MIYSEELTDIIDCIIKFDKTATDFEKARYLEIIQRDLKKLVASNKSDFTPKILKKKDFEKIIERYKS